MSNLKPIRKMTVELDRKFPEMIEYGSVEGKYYLKHSSSRHWDVNMYYFEHADHAMGAMADAASYIAAGDEVPRGYGNLLSKEVTF